MEGCHKINLKFLMLRIEPMCLMKIIYLYTPYAVTT